jgi:hypothetical protein
MDALILPFPIDIATNIYYIEHAIDCDPTCDINIVVMAVSGLD